MAKLLCPLTPHQVDFLRLVMQDYIDVTTDTSVMRDALNVRAALDKLRLPKQKQQCDIEVLPPK